MPNRLPKHLHDALTAARLALRFAADVDEAGYRADVMLRSAVERQLEILGEACRRALDQEPGLRNQWPEAVMAVGLRNRIIHGYDKVEHGLVLETVRRDLPLLITRLEAELQRFPLD
jgi:uncharacterized protein with HEPN domain